MQLPRTSNHYSVIVACGRYVATRLNKAKLKDLAGPVKTTTDAVKKAGRAWEDSLEPVQEAMALRDAWDLDMDIAVQDLRLKQSAVSLDATRTPPYTQIFPKGVSYYTAAPLTEVPQRMEELLSRVQAHLPAQDPLRLAAESAIQAGLTGFNQAVKDLKTARTARLLSRSELDEAMDEWSMLLEKTYGVLVSRLGRKAAEAFFPKTGSRVEVETEDSADKPDTPTPA